MIGQTISHYKILEKLGEGGMGVVYKAEDTRLGRIVALKFLPPELTRDKDAKTRFIHEAQAASALQHHNICAIHEIDETPDGRLFMSMDFYDGETLKDKIAKGPLPIDDAVDIVAQVAEGLAKAHIAGMVHRDIKPANIMITSDGIVKILDFGLAKLAGQTKVTKTGTTVGTVAYMSPEQARGDETDSRSDIWSVGVMLYEMLAGRLPFRGEVEPAMLYAIMNEDPQPVTTMRGDVPVGAEDIIDKALAKEPARRYTSMGELLSDVEVQRDKITLGIKERRFRAMRGFRRRKRMAAGAVAAVVLVAAAFVMQVFHNGDTAIDSIAVLPLENLSKDPDQEYFADGLTDGLITELSKINALRVISKTSVMRYRDTDKSTPEIARELNVAAVVEGSVFRDGERVRINAQLIGTEPERHLWADVYDRDLGDILALFTDVTQAIAGEIQLALTPHEQSRLASAHTVDPEAYDLYLRGHYQLLNKFTKEGAEKAIDYFQQAIEIDAGFAEAFAMLGAAYFSLGYVGGLTPEEASSRAGPPLHRALEIDELLPEAHYVMATIKHYFDWDWVGAEAGYKRAIALDPNLAEAHSDYANLLSAIGHSAEAIAEAKRAQQLDPFSFTTNYTLALVYNYAREHDQAIEQYQRMAGLESNDSRPYWGIKYTWEDMGRYEDAAKAFQEAMTLQQDPPDRVAAVVTALDSAYKDAGPEGYWSWFLESLKGREDQYALTIARCYAKLGDKDEAFVWLEKAYEKRDAPLCFLRVSGSWDSLRDDPRYEDLLRRMNFPEDEPPK